MICVFGFQRIFAFAANYGRLGGDYGAHGLAVRRKFSIFKFNIHEKRFLISAFL
ncbi:MAG: hypothetical protein LBB59_07195 [Campylobacteraceae bacterium]|nr:hypothetical protein [Campylobacteraceae bacterium]